MALKLEHITLDSISLSDENLKALDEAAKDDQYKALRGDVGAALNLLLPFGISRYKALVKDAIKRGVPLPGERAPRSSRAPRAPKAAASRDAVTELLKGSKSAEGGGGETAASKRAAKKGAKADDTSEKASAKTSTKTDAAPAGAKKGAKKGAKSNGEPEMVSWVVKIGKQEVAVVAPRDGRDVAIGAALGQVKGAKASHVKSAEIEE